jgi:intracellular sulfur oxidation DsrE/DsrF family protein
MKKILFLVALSVMAASTFAQGEKKQSKKGKKTEQRLEPLKIIFQLTTNDSLSHKALMKQLGNITSVEPETKIEVVCHGPGLDMLRSDKSIVTKKINEFASKGVVFSACEFSMKERNVTAAEIIPSVRFVKAGIIHIVRRQQAGWFYIKSGF